MRTHGTRSCYRAGCRCPECREAERLNMAAYRARLRAANLPRVERSCTDCGAVFTVESSRGRYPTRCLPCTDLRWLAS